MKTITFTISGNHKSESGNPVPKLKMTGAQHWTPRAKEYVQWKSHVVCCLIKAFEPSSKETRDFLNNIARHKKPIVLGPSDSAFMGLRIHWANKAHGDPENIFGSIADALFLNDKSLDCFVLSGMSQDALNGKLWGRVVVTIRLFGSEKEKIDIISQCKAITEKNGKR